MVGASLAGLRACEALRQEGYAGRVTLVGAEPHLPYDRPPLSKHVLAGRWEPERIRLRPPEALRALDLDLRLGVPARAFDAEARRIELADGSVVDGDGVIIATGSQPRRLPGQEQVPTVHELRTLDDAVRLRDALTEETRLVVIGAGFIGLEVAVTAHRRGCHVTVLEGLPAPLHRALGEAVGAAATAVHRTAGIDIRCSVSVIGLDGTGVTLSDGGVVPADVIVVGIGVQPAADWLAGSGLDLADGVICDATLATSVPGVYAAGDICRWPNELTGDEARIEHWTNAAEQGAAAARNLLATAAGGAASAYAPVPFFWSDQGDHRLQFLGAGGLGPDDRVEIVAGDPAANRFIALYGRGDRLRGVLGVNVPKQLMAYRALLLGGARWDDGVALAVEQRSSLPGPG